LKDSEFLDRFRNLFRVEPKMENQAKKKEVCNFSVFWYHFSINSKLFRPILSRTITGILGNKIYENLNSQIKVIRSEKIRWIQIKFSSNKRVFFDEKKIYNVFNESYRNLFKLLIFLGSIFFIKFNNSIVDITNKAFNLKKKKKQKIWKIFNLLFRIFYSTGLPYF